MTEGFPVLHNCVLFPQPTYPAHYFSYSPQVYLHDPVDWAEVEAMRQSLRACLGEAGFAKAYAQGQDLMPEETVQQALQLLCPLNKTD